MPTDNALIIEYKSICQKLAGLSPLADAASIEQLKLAKASVLDQLREVLGNRYRFKALLEQAAFDLLPPLQQRDIKEGTEASVARMHEQADAYAKHVAAGGAA